MLKKHEQRRVKRGLPGSNQSELLQFGPARFAKVAHRSSRYPPFGVIAADVFLDNWFA